jgi:hypothetical protein
MLSFAFHHFDFNHADAQLTRGVAENIALVGGLRVRRRNRQRVAARRVIEMQGGGGDIIGQR